MRLKTKLRDTHLENTELCDTHSEKTGLCETHLEKTGLYYTHLEKARLCDTCMDGRTDRQTVVNYRGTQLGPFLKISTLAITKNLSVMDEI